MSQPSILIVDDNPQNLQVIAKILLDNNFEVEYATNGLAALKWLKDKKFGIVLLDINMPGMDGYEVCRKIRSDPEISGIPIIFLTAEIDRQSILKGFDFGAQDYVTKPFESRELLARVRTHLTLKDTLEKLEILNHSLEEKVYDRTQQLNEANKKLEAINTKLLQLDRAKTDFLNLISHEIRTPLNGIIGPIQILKNAVAPQDMNDLIEMLDLSVKRLEKFSLNALLITRLKTKHVEIKQDKIPFGKLLYAVVNEEDNAIQSKNLQIKLDDETSGGILIGEEELIKKCIGTILDNAIIHSPSYGTIKIYTYFENQALICELIDDGTGFDPVIIDNSLELFTTSGEYKDNHIGIGLPIARMIMEGHGGEILIGNNPNCGAFVKLIFHNLEKKVNGS
jgi:two-component system, sensor histidine kinase and response regulator